MSGTGRRWARKRFSVGTVDGLPNRFNMMALSKALGISLATVQHWAKTGLRASKGSSRWEICRDDLKQFMFDTRRLIGAYPKRADRGR